MGFGKRENTFDWRIYMKKVPIKELREDLYIVTRLGSFSESILATRI